MNILGIIASSKFGDVGDFESIATTTLSTTTATVTFSSIPATYTHLQIRALIRMAKSSEDYLTTTFNSGTDVTARHLLTGNGSTASASGGSGTGQDFGPFPNSSHTASIFGVLILDILDYSNTNKLKQFKAHLGNDRNGSGQQVFSMGYWTEAGTAMNSLTFTMGASDTLSQYSDIALYGIKG